MAALIAPEISRAKRLVIKIGSALLVDRVTGLRQDWLAALALDVADMRSRGTDVVIVSSGSIALGRTVLGLPFAELALEQSQAAAAVGQIRLARAYEEVLAPHGIITGQVLVTLEDTEDRRRYLNSRATLETLLGLGVVPIVNENDTVATDEIRFGDDDRLAAQIAVTVGADQLILLSDVDGFYSANPKEDPSAVRFDVVDKITWCWHLKPTAWWLYQLHRLSAKTCYRHQPDFNLCLGLALFCSARAMQKTVLSCLKALGCLCKVKNRHYVQVGGKPTMKDGPL